MPERFTENDSHYITRYEKRRPNSSSFLIPLLLLPIAFLGGWVANGYVNDGQLNEVPGIEVGVGGGPEGETRIVSPLPTSGVTRPTVSPTTTPLPTDEPLSPTPEE